MHSLKLEGMATGIVVSCSATHATPAAFIAHKESRAFTRAIAADYLGSGLDCYIGGGEEYFRRRPDKKPLIDSLVSMGYVINRNANFKNLPMDGSAPFYAFTAFEEPGTATKGRNYLPKAAGLACEYLKNRSDQGFFLMVEGSQIDWALHANDSRWLRDEMADWEQTVRTVLEFAAQDGETLVILTGDHECAGMSLNGTGKSRYFEPRFASRVHSAALVPVLAYGPGAKAFTGLYDNTDLYFKMREAVD